jgi:hypothetical protein
MEGEVEEVAIRVGEEKVADVTIKGGPRGLWHGQRRGVGGGG